MTQNNRFTIVTGYDFSDTAELSLDEALLGAKRYGTADLHVVAVLDDRAGRHPTFDDSEKLRDEINKVLSQKLAGPAPESLTIRVHVRIGSPYEQLLEVAEEASADLIVVGTHGRSGVKRVLLGSVSERVARLAQCPVYIVRPKGYEEVNAADSEFAPEPPPAKGEPQRKPLPVHTYSYTTHSPNRQESILW